MTGTAIHEGFSAANKSRVCVFAGSSIGAKPTYSEQAVILGKSLAAQDIQLVYGGANIGLMSVVADAVLDNGCLLYTSPSPRDGLLSRMPSSA